MFARASLYRSWVRSSPLDPSVIVVALAALALAAGCPSAPRAREPARAVEPALIEAPRAIGSEATEAGNLEVPEEDAAPDGVACTRTSDCESGQACRGPRGCESAWACGEALDCSGERVAYCDCDGSTFYAPRGCPGRPYAYLGACDAVGPLAGADELGMHAYDEQPTTADRACTSSAECPSGRQCYGPPGCGVTWRCERLRGCRGPRVELCGCDGVTFRAVAACAGRPYLHVGACDGELAVAEATPGGAPPRSSPTGPAAATSPTAGASSTSAPPASLAPATGGERACASQRDCPRGEICEGPEGCGVTWTCRRPAARCNPDTQVFCDCERNTFRASMTCPGRPYAHRGSCEIDRMLELSGASAR